MFVALNVIRAYELKDNGPVPQPGCADVRSRSFMRKHGENMYFEDFELGMKWDLDRPIHISRELMRDYASKYDAAPIHNDDEVGKRSKFGQIIAPGHYDEHAFMVRVDPPLQDARQLPGRQLKLYRLVHAAA